VTVSWFPLPLAGTFLDAPAAVEGTPTVAPQGANWIDPDPATGAAFGPLLAIVLESLGGNGLKTGLPLATETVQEPAEPDETVPEVPETSETDRDPAVAVAVAVPAPDVPPVCAELPPCAQPQVQAYGPGSEVTPEKPVSHSWPSDAARRVSLPEAEAGDRSSDLPPASSGSQDVPLLSNPDMTEECPGPENPVVREAATVISRLPALAAASAEQKYAEPGGESSPQKDRPPVPPNSPIAGECAVPFGAPPPDEAGRTAIQRPASRPTLTVRTAPGAEPSVADAKPAFSMRIIEADRDGTADIEARSAPSEHPAGGRSRRATQADTPPLEAIPHRDLALTEDRSSIRPSLSDPITIATAPAARPGRPVQAETARAGRPESGIGKTEPPEIAVRRMPETHHGPAMRHISLRVAEGAEERVEVRLAEQSGELRVDVRARNEVLAGRLREGLPELVGRLKDGGFEAEVWRPSRIDTSEAPGRRDERAAENGQERNPDGQRGSGRQGEEGGRRRHPQDGHREGEVFDPGFHLRTENGQE
jgi:hypothetical protein